MSHMIIHTGEALIDFIPVRDAGGRTAFFPAPGGSPYNASIAVARLEAPAAFFGRISRDFFGDQLVQGLVDNGVSTELVLRDQAPSTLAFVKKNDRGEARYAFFAEGAADRRVLPGDLPELPQSTRALQFGSIALIPDPVGETILSLAEHCRGRCLVSFDPNIRTSLVTDEEEYRRRIARGVAASTVVKVSDEDLLWMSGSPNLEEGARSLLEQGPSLVVVTEGSAGARAWSRDIAVAVPAEKTSVTDTIGAGDSFHAALLAWLHHSGLLDTGAISGLGKDDISAMLRFAGAVAAKTCSRAGADPPRLSEVQTRFRSW
ncbi:carbohydrate kinase family protein [Alkalispirochaeta sphaeroplastigenens]|nr:carbohydrate kinase [Alkalispirochaeta sphaeroplastigenens]